MITEVIYDGKHENETYFRIQSEGGFGCNPRRSDQTVTELASLYKVHPNQITTWKRQAQDQLVTAFDNKKAKSLKADEKLKEELYCQIGQLKVELDWLKKKSGL